MITHKQLTLAEVFEDCQNKFDHDKYQFLSLLDESINLDEIVPVSFVIHFHASTGRPRKHQLYPMLKAFLIQRIFSIPTDMLLIVFLKYSQELLDFCARRLVEMAAYTIMGHLMVQDASKNAELFGTSAQVFVRYAESEVEKHINFIRKFDKDDLAYYRK